MPGAVLISGVNGAGKTTFARHFVPSALPRAQFLNADEIQREGQILSSPLRAGRELIRRLGNAVATHTDFMIETTLSSRQYAPRIPDPKSNGFSVILIFLEVPDAGFAVGRVEMPVAQGGHDIRQADIRRRLERGLAMIHSMYRPLEDSWYWYKWNGQDHEIDAQSGVRLWPVSD